MKINFVIPCLLGMESLIANELKELEAENVVKTEESFSAVTKIFSPESISAQDLPRECRFLSAHLKQEALRSFFREQRLFLGKSG